MKVAKNWSDGAYKISECATYLIGQSAIDSAAFGRELKAERLVAGRNLKSAIVLLQ